MTTTEKPHCCFIPDEEQSVDGAKGCERDAEYEILDGADYTEMATTYACTAHVGEMLGHSEGSDWDPHDGTFERWEVTAL